MGTGICSARAPGLPAGFKQYAAIATDTGRLAWWAKHDGGGDVCLGGANETLGWRLSFLGVFLSVEG